jgi:hypothetical protein
MLHVMSVRIPIEAGDAALSDPNRRLKMPQVLAAIKAQAACFTTMDGRCGSHVVVVRAKAGPGVAAAVRKWG